MIRGIGRLSRRSSLHNVSQLCRIVLDKVSHRFMASKPLEVRMPALSPTMSEGTIVKWLKNEGEVINPGDALCEIQTDKAVMSLEVEEQGILAKILMPDDSKDVKIGTLIALYVEEGEDWKDVVVPASSSAPLTAPAATKSSASPPIVASTVAESAPASKRTLHVTLGPAARTLLHTYGVEASIVAPTGPHGVLLKSDILNYIKLKSLAPKKVESVAPAQALQPKKSSSKQPAAGTATGHLTDFVDIPNSGMRLTIAKRLSESKSTVPHSYCTVDCHMDAVTALRKQLKDDGVKVTVNDFLIKAIAGALQQVPEVNAQWTPEGVKLLDKVDISVAVATDTGLITPIVPDAVSLGLQQISDKVKELSDKARRSKLKPQEFMGGSFTISNLGMFGITEFSAIINPPQCAILAVGTSRLIPDAEGGAPTSRMTATMSYDRRAFDEQTAAHFLHVFASLMETPATLVAGGAPASQQLRSSVQI